MSSGLLNPLRRNIGFKLSLWYALIFLLSSGLLFMVAYYLLAAAIGRKDREVLDARLKEAAAVYQAGGVGGLRNWVRVQPTEFQNSLFVRLVGPFDMVNYISVPPDWVSFRDIPGWAGRFQERTIRFPQSVER